MIRTMCWCSPPRCRLPRQPLDHLRARWLPHRRSPEPASKGSSSTPSARGCDSSRSTLLARRPCPCHRYGLYARTCDGGGPRLEDAWAVSPPCPAQLSTCVEGSRHCLRDLAACQSVSRLQGQWLASGGRRAKHAFFSRSHHRTPPKAPKTLGIPGGRKLGYRHESRLEAYAVLGIGSDRSTPAPKPSPHPGGADGSSPQAGSPACARVLLELERSALVSSNASRLLRE